MPTAMGESRGSPPRKVTSREGPQADRGAWTPSESRSDQDVNEEDDVKPLLQPERQFGQKHLPGVPELRTHTHEYSGSPTGDSGRISQPAENITQPLRSLGKLQSFNLL
jgi:hypothetical protein